MGVMQNWAPATSTPAMNRTSTLTRGTRSPICFSFSSRWALVCYDLIVCLDCWTDMRAGFSYADKAPGSINPVTGGYENASYAGVQGRYPVINATEISRLRSTRTAALSANGLGPKTPPTRRRTQRGKSCRASWAGCRSWIRGSSPRALICGRRAMAGEQLMVFGRVLYC